MYALQGSSCDSVLGFYFRIASHFCLGTANDLGPCPAVPNSRSISPEHVICGCTCVHKLSCLTEIVHLGQGTQSAGSKQPEGSWAHEQYEEDAAFSKYTKRLQRCPGQCLRLSASGSLLWPRKELPVAPRYGMVRCSVSLYVFWLSAADVILPASQGCAFPHLLTCLAYTLCQVATVTVAYVRAI